MSNDLETKLPFLARPTSRRVSLPLVGLVLAAFLVGCEDFTGTSPTAPTGEGPAHRQQRLALSPQEELALGRQAYQEILSSPDEFGRPLPSDHPEHRRVRDICKRIVHAAGIEPLQREINLRTGYRYEWEVHVFNSSQINAFCLPGGKIGVFTGILKVVQNDDQLATVLSHEIGHALAHHTSERIANRQMNRGAWSLIRNRAFDRQEESEADHIGLFLMTFAEFDPRESVHFWERMEQATAGRHGLPEILSDHPSDARRIADLKAWVPRAIAAKEAYDRGDIAPKR